jgi:hypothetical protein
LYGKAQYAFGYCAPHSLRFYAKEVEMSRMSTQMVDEGKYMADVSIELIEDETGWSPHVSEVDVSKLDRVRLALRRGDIVAAAREAKVFELTPVAG